jgi:hypothetical protein
VSLADDPRHVLAAGVGQAAHACGGLDLDAAGRGQVLRPALGHHPAAVDDHDPVADELDLAEQVRVQQHADPLLAQPDEQVAHRAPAARVERARRLVEQHEPRVADQRLGDAQPLLHALAHRCHPASALAREADPCEQRLALRRPAVGAGEALMQLEHLLGTCPGGEAKQLGEVAGRCPRVAAAGRGAGDLRLATRGPHQAAGDLDQRRLAGAVGPEQSDELARSDLEVDGVERGRLAVALREGAGGEGRGRHRGVLSQSKANSGGRATTTVAAQRAKKGR